MTLRTIPDIAGAGSVVGIVDDDMRASWAQIVVKGIGTVRVGGANTSATEGIPIAAGEEFFLPFMPVAAYRINGIKLYVPIGATVSVLWMG